MKFAHAAVVFWFALGMSTASFLLFCYVAIVELRLRRRQIEQGARNLESMGKVGDLAEKFARSGVAASTLACTVFFMLMGTIIGLTLDQLSIASLFRF